MFCPSQPVAILDLAGLTYKLVHHCTSSLLAQFLLIDTKSVSL